MMKKYLLAAVLAVAGLAASVRPASAQILDGPEAGTSIVSARIGLGSILGTNVAYDYCVAQVWKGGITVGGGVGYMWDMFRVWPGEARHFHTVDFTTRTTYRLSVVVPDWEVYAGLAMGGGFYAARDSNVRGLFVAGALMGTSYYFTSNLGANFEMNLGGTWPNTRGRAWNWLNLGISYKF